MVRLPSYDNFQVSPDTAPAPYANQSATPDAFGAGVGQAIQGMGQTVQQQAKVYQQIKTQEAQRDVENDYAGEIGDSLRQFDQSYTSLSGKKAVDGYEKTMEDLQAYKTKTLGEYTDPLKRQMMEQILNDAIGQRKDMYGRHRTNETAVYDKQVASAMKGRFSQNAVDNYNNPDLFNTNVIRGLTHIELGGAKRGDALEAIEIEKRDFLDDVYSRTATVMMQLNPEEGLAWLAERADEMSPEVYAKQVKSAEPLIRASQVDTYMTGVESGFVSSGFDQGASGASFDAPLIQEPPAQYRGLIEREAKAFGINPIIFKNMGFSESNFKPNAISHMGARGLFQLMPPTAKDMGFDPDEMHIPEKNVKAGAKYMKKMLGMFGENYALALAGYNAGPGRVKKAMAKAGEGASTRQILDALPPKTKEETIPYVRKILTGDTKNKSTTTAFLEAHGEETKEIRPIQKIDNIQDFQDLFDWKKEMVDNIPRSYDPRSRTSIRAKIHTRYKEKYQELTQRKNADINLVYQKVNDEKREYGDFDLDRMRQDPDVREALERQPRLADTLLTRQEEDEEGQRREARQERKDARAEIVQARQDVKWERGEGEEASANKLRILEAKLGFSKEARLKVHYDDAELDSLTAKHKLEFMTNNEKIISSNNSDAKEKQIKEFQKEFDSAWSIAYGKSVTPTARDDKYWNTFAIGREQVLSFIEQNEGKSLGFEERTRIANNTIAQGGATVPIDWASDPQLATYVKTLKEGEFKDETLADLMEATFFVVKSGEYVDPIKIKKVLEEMERGR